jgi:hypothetical protein
MCISGNDNFLLSDDKDECFVVIFNIFIKFGRLKITKIVTFLSLLFQFVFYLLQLCYVIIKFDQDLVMRYSCTIVMTLYVSTVNNKLSNNLTCSFGTKVLYTTVFMNTYKYEKLQKRFQVFAWSVDSAGAEVKDTILERSTKTNRICYLIILFLCAAVIINCPVWGDQSELFLFTQVVEYFFGKWLQIPSNIYFATYSIVCYGSFRLPFEMLHIILQLQVQIVLLNRQILQIGDNFNSLDDWDKTYSLQYQKEISETFQFIVEQHSAIKR